MIRLDENFALADLLSHICKILNCFSTQRFQQLTFPVAKYLADLFSACVLWSNDDFDQVAGIHPSINSTALVWLRSELGDVNGLVELGINSGCQAFVVTSSMTLMFLDSFNSVRFSTENRYNMMRVVYVLESGAEDAAGRIANHPVTSGENFVNFVNFKSGFH